MPLIAGPLDQNERNRAMSALHASRKLFLDSVANLSEAQWKFKPAPDRWSVAECAEHIALAEDLIFKTITDRVMKTPEADEAARKQAEGKDEKIAPVITDRSSKFQAPEFLRPSNKWHTQKDLVEAFKASRDRNIEFVEKTGEDLRAHVAPHPALGPIDAYEWILFLSAHSERHTLQIKEVQADPNFPKK